MGKLLTALTVRKTGEAAFIPIAKVSNSSLPLVLPVILLLITWLIFSLRIWTRARIIKFFGWDDKAMVVAIVSVDD
jgi:hypothetical protein